MTHNHIKQPEAKQKETIMSKIRLSVLDESLILEVHSKSKLIYYSQKICQ